MIRFKRNTPRGLRLVKTLSFIFFLWVSVYGTIISYQEKEFINCTINITFAIIFIITIIRDCIQYMLEDNSDMT